MFYGDEEHDLTLKIHDWAAVIGGQVVVIPPALFEGSVMQED